METIEPKLTRESILAMGAGDALNRIVASQVIGMVECPLWMHANFGSGGGPVMIKGRCNHEPGKCYPYQANPQPIANVFGCPRFSEDIAAAWQVIEVIRNERPQSDYSIDSGPWFAVDAPDATISHECPAKGKWQAGWRRGLDYEGESFLPDLSAVAETAPLAICRAALLLKVRD